jgi:hypothetical protein
MELTARQRMLAFAVTVVVLAGLGFYLLWPGKSHPAARPSPRPVVTSSPRPAPSSTPSIPAADIGSLPSSSVNIYQWLPFTQADLGRAAAIATEFCAYYGTYSYQESTADYVNRLKGLATGQFAQVLAEGYSTQGVASLRQKQKQVSTGSAVIDSLRAFGPSSLTFVVTVTADLSGTQGPGQQSTQYAVTVTNSDGGWLVNDIELASLGNQ